MGGLFKRPKVNVSTPESEKAAARYNIRMMNAAGEVQGNVFEGFMKDTLRETGHRQSGSTSADISRVAAEHQKQFQANPLAVAERTSKQSTDTTQAGLLAKGTAYLSDTSKRVAGTKFGTQSVANTVAQATQHANNSHQLAMNKARSDRDKQQSQMNSLAAIGGAGLGLYQDHKAKQSAARVGDLKSGKIDLWQFGRG